MFQDGTGPMVTDEPSPGGGTTVWRVRHGDARRDAVRSRRRLLGLAASCPAGREAGRSHAVLLARMVLLAGVDSRYKFIDLD